MRVMAVLLFLASGAAAQEPPVDRGVIEGCFEAGHAGAGEMPSCVGDAADICRTRPGGGTTLGITDCLQAETAVWAGLMNAVLEHKRQALSSRGPGVPQALDRAQAAWLAYRDAECGLRYAVWIEGSIRTVIAANCHLEKTAGRALELAGLGEME